MLLKSGESFQSTLSYNEGNLTGLSPANRALTDLAPLLQSLCLAIKHSMRTVKLAIKGYPLICPLHSPMSTKVQLSMYWKPASKSPLWLPQLSCTILNISSSHRFFPFYFYKLPFVYGPCLSHLYPEAVLCPPTPRTSISAPSPLFPSPSS